VAQVSEFGGSYWQVPGITSTGHAELTVDTINLEDFRTVADNLPTLCWLARADGFIVWYNRRWHDYCGTKPQDMEGWGRQ
jgi:PAS domain-containing protein